MEDYAFTTWSSEFNTLAAQRQIAAVDPAIQRFLYDEGLEPDEAAQPVRIAPYLRNSRPHPKSASVAEMIAARFKPSAD